MTAVYIIDGAHPYMERAVGRAGHKVTGARAIVVQGETPKMLEADLILLCSTEAGILRALPEDLWQKTLVMATRSLGLSNPRSLVSSVVPDARPLGFFPYERAPAVLGGTIERALARLARRAAKTKPKIYLLAYFPQAVVLLIEELGYQVVGYEIPARAPSESLLRKADLILVTSVLSEAWRIIPKDFRPKTLVVDLGPKEPNTILRERAREAGIASVVSIKIGPETLEDAIETALLRIQERS
jgi:hypothetical protein